MLHERRHPEQGFRTRVGILRLYRGLATARAEAVPARAIVIGALSYLSYRSNASVTADNLDRRAARPAGTAPVIMINPPSLRCADCSTEEQLSPCEISSGRRGSNPPHQPW